MIAKKEKMKKKNKNIIIQQKTISTIFKLNKQNEPNK